MARESATVCPVQSLMATITKRWFLLTLNKIGRHRKAHYNELFAELNPISPKSLADVLKELQNIGLVRKDRNEYSLTGSGEKLRSAVTPLLKWSVEFTGHKNCPILAEPTFGVSPDLTMARQISVSEEVYSKLSRKKGNRSFSEVINEALEGRKSDKETEKSKAADARLWRAMRKGYKLGKILGTRDDWHER